MKSKVAAPGGRLGPQSDSKRQAPRRTVAAGDVLGGRYVLVAPNHSVRIAGTWEAIDGKTQNRVSIRVVDASAFEREGARAAEKFRVSARRLHQLPHPRIPRILDVHAEGELGPPYLVTEWIDGIRWTERRKRSPERDRADELGIALRVCEALTPLHDRGIVHRSAAPESVLLERVSPPGRSPWVDVRIIEFDFLEQRRDGKTRLGDTDGLPGAIEYMAPEQFEGADVDARSDVWALGVILYEAISGTLPFRGRTRFEAMASILRDPVAPLSAENGIPSSLVDLVDECLRRDPTKRPATARTVRDALHCISASNEGLISDSIRDDLPVAAPTERGNASSITRLGAMHWNVGAGTASREDDSVTRVATSWPGSAGVRVLAAASAVLALAAVVWASAAESPAAFAHRFSIDSDVVGATLVVQGVRRLALGGPSEPSAIVLEDEPSVQNLEVLCGSRVLHRLVLDLGVSQTLPVVMRIGDGNATTCDSFDDTVRPPTVATPPIAAVEAPRSTDAGVDERVPWHDCVGAWRGGDVYCTYLVTVLAEPDSQRRVVRMNACGTTYSSRSLEMREGQWRTWVSDGGGGYAVRLSCGPNGAGEGTVSDGASYRLRREARAP